MLDQPTRTGARALLAAAGAGLIVAACGPSASPVTAPPAAPTAAQPTTAPAASAAQPTPAAPPTAIARPTQPTTTSTTADPPTAAGAGAGTSAPPSSQSASTNDVIKLVFDQASTQAKYHAREQLAGRSLPSEAVGTSTAVTGALVLGTDGSVKADQSKIEVDLRQLKSDESRRDNFIQGSTLQTSRFPMATFAPREVQGLSNPLPTSGQATFQLLGDLTVHGVTKPVTWQVSAEFTNAAVTGNATTNVNISDFGMTPPKAGPVLSIADALTLEMVFTANREA
jgi:polyisoprenoid-binding protein YceI